MVPVAPEQAKNENRRGPSCNRRCPAGRTLRPNPPLFEQQRVMETDKGKSKICRTSSTLGHGNGGPSAGPWETAMGGLFIEHTASTPPQPHFGDGAPIVVKKLTLMGVCVGGKGDVGGSNF